MIYVLYLYGNWEIGDAGKEALTNLKAARASRGSTEIYLESLDGSVQVF